MASFALSTLLGLLVAQPGLSLAPPPPQQGVVRRALDASNSVASNSNFGFPRPGGDRTVPWGLNQNAYTQAIERPDSQSVFEFLGQDLSIAYSGIGLTPGWTLSINVTNNVPLSTSNDTVTSDGTSIRDKFATGARIKIGAPQKLRQANGVFSDPTWNFCVFLLTSTTQGSLGFVDRLRGDNGSCAVTMGAQCAADLELAVQTNMGGVGKGTKGANLCNCPDLNAVSSCSGAFSGGVQCSTYSFNSSYLATKWTDGTFPLFDYAGPIHQSAPGTTSFSEFVRGLVWPVITFWGAGLGVGNGTAKLTCVTANTPQRDVKLSSAAGLELSSWLFTAAAAAVGFTLL